MKDHDSKSQDQDQDAYWMDLTELLVLFSYLYQM